MECEMSILKHLLKNQINHHQTIISLRLKVFARGGDHSSSRRIEWMFAFCLSFICFSTELYASPVLSNVASGDVHIQQTGGNTVVHQASQQAIINWHNFNIASGEKTQFIQPNSSSVALNRIDPNQGVSQIFGQLTANGQIILVNQSGIFFGPGARVDVVGLIATTANISNANFLSGNYLFDQIGFSGATITNAGLIQAAEHGLIALVGNNVRNDGTIIAHGGNVILASGATFVISLDNSGLISFVSNEYARKVGNGMVELTQQDAQQLVDQVVNLSGIQQASYAAEQNGDVILSDSSIVDVSGESGGTALILAANKAEVSGNILANATGAGNGGFIETSGNILDISGIQVNTTALHGSTGMWLLDPTNIYIASSQLTATTAGMSGTNTSVDSSGNPFTASGAVTDSLLLISTLQDALALTNVSVTTTNASESASGNIILVNPITWSSTISTNTLTLNAARNIYLNADITATYGGLVLNARSAATDAQSITSGSEASPSATGVTANINVANFNITSGGWYQVNSTLPTFSISNNFQLNSGNGPNSAVQFIRATNSSTTNIGQVSNPYQLTDIYGVQGVGSNATTLSQSYLLANNINANNGAITTWNSGAGFFPLGQPNNGATQFAGSFNGGNFTLSNFYVNRTTSDVGLFSIIKSGASVSNLNLTGSITSGGFRIGGLAGQNSGTISGVTSAINISTAGGQIGGLVGLNNSGGIITQSSASGNILETATNGHLGGLVGANNGSISYAFSTGNISMVSTIAGGGGFKQQVGGLIGSNGSSATLSHVYSSSNLIFDVPNGFINYVGGLIGQNSAIAIINGNEARVAFDISGPCGGTICSIGSISQLSSNLGGLVNVGGFVGHNTGGSISGVINFPGTIIGNMLNAGGFVGLNRGAINNSAAINVSIIGADTAGGFAGADDVNGVINNSYASGSVQANTQASALVNIVSSATAAISNSYSVARVSSSNGNGAVGTLTAGSISNIYWNTQTSGQSSSAAGTGLTTAQMMDQANFTGFDFSSTWGIIEGKSYPYLQQFYASTPRVISGSSTIGAGQAIQLIKNGSNLANSGLSNGTTTTGANGFYYFLESNGVIADSDKIIVANSANNAYSLSISPSAGGSIIGQSLAANTLNLGDNSNSTFSNSILGTFSSQYSALPISVSSNNLIIGTASVPNLNFIVNTSSTSYTVNGNVSTYNNGGGNGNLIFNGPITLTANSIFTSGNAGVTFGGTVNGGFGLTINGSGMTNFGSDLGATTALSSLTLNTAVTLGVIATSIRTSGAQTYNQAITLSANSSPTFSTTSGTTGDIILNQDLSWGDTSTLNLTASRNIYLNANISATNGSLVLNARSAVTDAQSITSGSQASPSANGVTANINVANFNITRGGWYQVNNTLPSLPSFSATNFRLNSGGGANNNVQFIRAKSGNGSSGNPYQLTDIYGLQGVGSNTTTLASSTGNYILANDVDASGTVNWNSGQGWRHLGTFNGVFNGIGHTITGLYINRPTIQNIGLFSINAGIISNLGLVQGSTGTIRGASNVGALLGTNNSIGIISNVHSDVTVENVTTTSVGSIRIGGLVGQNDGLIDSSYTTGIVRNIVSTGAVLRMGGIVGLLGGGSVISNSYSSASVRSLASEGGSVTGSGSLVLGGIASVSVGAAAITDSFSSGNISFTDGANTSTTGSIILGGILANPQGVVITDVTSTANLTINTSSTSSYSTIQVGGISGNVSGSGSTDTVSNVGYSGSIQINGQGASIGSLYVGGINGSQSFNNLQLSINNSNFSGSITSNATAGSVYIGGIAGDWVSLVADGISGATSTGNISVNNNQLAVNSVISIGGITGNIPTNLNQSANTSNTSLIQISDSSVTNIWTISGVNTGSMSNGIGAYQFNNIKNLTGSAGSDVFNFLTNGEITGTVDGGTGNDTLDFSSYGSAIKTYMSILSEYAGTIKNSAENTIAIYQNIHNINANNQGTLITANKQNTITITNAVIGFVNDPLYFFGFNNFIGQGQTQVNFNGAPAILNLSTYLATIDGINMQFSNIISFTGNYTEQSNVTQAIQSSSSVSSSSDGSGSDLTNTLTNTAFTQPTIQSINQIINNQLNIDTAQKSRTTFGICN